MWQIPNIPLCRTFITGHHVWTQFKKIIGEYYLLSVISDAGYWILPHYKEVADEKANHHPTMSPEIYLNGKKD